MDRLINIYRLTDGGEVVIIRIAADNTTLSRTIMGADEVSIEIVSDSVIDIQVGDYISLNGQSYELNREANFEKLSNVEYRYNYIFEAPIYRLLDKIFCNKITHSTRVILTGKLSDFLELLVWNINRSEDNSLGVDTGWTVGVVADTEYKNITLEGIPCRQVLDELAAVFECEYYVHGKTINYSYRIENETGLIFKQGDGEGLYRITQQNVDSDNVITRIFPKGGETNVPFGKGDETGRLILPEYYIENFDEYDKPVERVVEFSDIHPSFTGTVTDVTGENNRIFKCPEIDFDVSEIAVDKDARVNFLTGDLMGKAFEFQWNNETNEIKLLYQEDELAAVDPETQTRPNIPSESKYLRGDEKFTLTGVLLGGSYLNNAIDRLRLKAQKWLEFHSRKRVKFELTVDHRYMRGKPDLNPGDLVNIIVPEHGIDKIIRIVSIDKKLYSGEITCTVSNYLEEKWEDKIEGAISQIQATVNNGDIKSNEIEIIEQYDARPATDRRVFSALRSLTEFLSKQKDDVSQGLIKFMKGAHFGTFIDSMSAGMGAGIMPDGRGQFETIEVRGALRVLELIYNRIAAEESDRVFTEAGTVDYLEKIDDTTYRLTMRKEWENDFTAFREGDVLRGIVNNLAKKGEYATSWLRLLSVNTTANTITVSMYPDSEVNTGANIPPTELMVLQRWGNTFNTDRQSTWYLSSREGRIVWLTGVTKPILDEHNYSSFYGKPVHLSIFEGQPIDYNEPYLYVKGLIAENLIKVDHLGHVIKDFRDRGIWKSNPEESYRNMSTLQDDVWHLGAKWRCLVDQTKQEPKWNATHWQQIEGSRELTCEMYPTNGQYFYADTVDFILHWDVKYGYDNINSDIDPGDVAWTRDSGDVVADNLWAVQHAGIFNDLHITDQDIGHDFDENGVAFKVTIFVRDGDVTKLEETFTV